MLDFGAAKSSASLNKVDAVHDRLSMSGIPIGRSNLAILR